MASGVRRALGALGRRLRRERFSLELEPPEQWVLLHLYRTERAPTQDLADEIRVHRPLMNDQQIRAAILRLESLGLIERARTESGNGNRGRVYAVSGRGKRLRGVIPVEPLSTIQVRL